MAFRRGHAHDFEVEPRLVVEVKVRKSDRSADRSHDPALDKFKFLVQLAKNEKIAQ